MTRLVDECWWQKPAVLSTQVMHKRLSPKINQFVYRVYYLSLPEHGMADATSKGLRHNRFGAISFYDKDHGNRDGTNPCLWARAALQQCKLDIEGLSLIVVAMPRTWGFVFNPVSFWMCVNAEGALKAVIAEVNNTFGETHSYVLAHADGRDITADDWLEADKHFHVSPFLTVEGYYRFRFAWGKTVGIWIDHHAADGTPLLLTSMHCKPHTLNTTIIWKHVISLPLVSLKALALIHWQAIKLVAKKVRYYRKPSAPKEGLTTWRP